jgi:spore coat polysaccharide biosynthesis protein SpsF (cytidylyltransferase family)
MVVAIIQARMNSSRLPGKVLKLVGSKTVLARVIERVGRAHMPDKIVVATTNGSLDDPVEKTAIEAGVSCFRGAEDDVLGRFYGAALQYGADAIVRITADCPLIDPTVIDRVISVFGSGNYDYAANINPPTYPDGLDVECVSGDALARACRDARLPSEREHVTLFIRRRPDLFRIGNVRAQADYSQLRWVLDEEKDLAFVRAAYAHFGEASFGLEDMLTFVERETAVARINAGIARDEGLRKSLQAEGA